LAINRIIKHQLLVAIDFFTDFFSTILELHGGGESFVYRSPIERELSLCTWGIDLRFLRLFREASKQGKRGEANFSHDFGRDARGNSLDVISNSRNA